MSSFDPSILIPRYGTAHEWCYDTNGKPYSREHITQRAHQWIDERIAEMYPPPPPPEHYPPYCVYYGGKRVAIASNLVRLDFIPSDKLLCVRRWTLLNPERIAEASKYKMPVDDEARCTYDVANHEIRDLLFFDPVPPFRYLDEIGH